MLFVGCPIGLLSALKAQHCCLQFRRSLAFRRPASLYRIFRGVVLNIPVIALACLFNRTYNWFLLSFWFFYQISALYRATVFTATTWSVLTSPRASPFLLHRERVWWRTWVAFASFSLVYWWKFRLQSSQKPSHFITFLLKEVLFSPTWIVISFAFLWVFLLLKNSIASVLSTSNSTLFSWPYQIAFTPIFYRVVAAS